MSAQPEEQPHSEPRDHQFVQAVRYVLLPLGRMVREMATEHGLSAKEFRAQLAAAKARRLSEGGGADGQEALGQRGGAQAAPGGAPREARPQPKPRGLAGPVPAGDDGAQPAAESSLAAGGAYGEVGSPRLTGRGDARPAGALADDRFATRRRRAHAPLPGGGAEAGGAPDPGGPGRAEEGCSG